MYNNKYVGTLKQFSNSTYVKFELRKSLRSALITYLGGLLYYYSHKLQRVNRAPVISDHFLARI